MANAACQLDWQEQMFFNYLMIAAVQLTLAPLGMQSFASRLHAHSPI